MGDPCCASCAEAQRIIASALRESQKADSAYLENALEHLLLARIQVLAIPPEASDLALNPSYRFGKG